MTIYSLWSIRHYAVFDQNTTLFTHLHVSETTSTVKAYEVVGLLNVNQNGIFRPWGHSNYSALDRSKYDVIYTSACTFQNHVNKLSSSSYELRFLANTKTWRNFIYLYALSPDHWCPDSWYAKLSKTSLPAQASLCLPAGSLLRERRVKVRQYNIIWRLNSFASSWYVTCNIFLGRSDGVGRLSTRLYCSRLSEFPNFAKQNWSAVVICSRKPVIISSHFTAVNECDLHFLS